ncbi:MAG: type II toxin-antitoxin system RelE/ParE family toxin [Bryobacteraceae bacterium]
MIYKVIVTLEAKRNLRDAYLFIRRDSADAASRWSKGARRSIRALGRFPARCPIAPEGHALDAPIRELLYGSGNRGTYRILFVIVDNTVFGLHVRHGSMQPLPSNDS